jgi:glyoxylase-like metal-dependent hydrolase (beta-lactamase superfamily II)
VEDHKLPNVHIIDLHFLQTSGAIAAFLLESEAGPILIETGPYSTFPKLKKDIEGLGYGVEDVQHVFVTHIHFDHAGAAWAFAEHGATVYVHPLGAPHLQNPEKLLESARRIYLDQMDALWGTLQVIPSAQMRVVGHEESIAIGGLNIRALHTPGHAVHHIAWQLGASIFAGDIAGVKIGEGIVVPPCPPPDINIEHWQASLALLRRLNPQQLFLSHYGLVEGNCVAHLDELESRLLAWATWIEPYFRAGTPQAEVIPLFEAYTEAELTAAGTPPSVALRYAAANPTFMSVAGLYRYWYKKEGVSS